MSVITPAHAADDAAGLEFFEKKIRPVLVEQCYQCHSALAKEVKGGLLVDSREAIRKGGESGAAVVPGKPGESLLVAALRRESFEMPPERALSKAVVDDFIRWIEIGAPDPRNEPPNPEARLAAARDDQFQQFRQWWSLQPVVEPAIPDVRNSEWSSQPIDRFILAKLEAQGLQPAPRADRPTLVRRLSFALTGLPPTPEEVAAFVDDAAPDAWPRLVDRLLDSPHFGERWARHWMDVVRYTDTYGYEWDIPAKGAWRYRDYLIRAFNADVPFDQLVREHIAGDLLERPRIDPVERINESLAGTMFFQMGEKRHGDSAEFDGIHQEMLDNKVDAFSKAFQAQTFACARCHDHKLDPVLQSEYYALGGVFMSSRWVTNTLDTPERNANVFAELKEIKTELRAELAALWLEELATLPKVALTAPREDSEQSPTPATSEPPDPRRRVWQHLLVPDAKEPPLEDLRHPWFHLAHAAKQDPNANIADEWRKLAARYVEQRQQRTEQNAADFTVIADFRENTPDGWSIDGVGLQERIACGDFTVALDGPAAVGRLLPGGLFTHALSPRLNGAIRTPYLNRFDKAHITFEYCGGDFSAQRTVVDNAFLTERQQYLNQQRMDWLRLSTFPTMRERRIYLELATKTSNPNFPPRVGLGGACSEEQARDPRSWFGVSRVLLHDKAAAPLDELTRFESLFKGDAPGDLNAAAERYARWFVSAVKAWAADAASDDDVRLINWLLEHEQLTNRFDVAGRPRIAEFVKRYRETERRIREPQTVNGMADIDSGYDLPLNIRGEYDQPAGVVPRGYPRALGGSADGFACHGSGRRELAELVADPHNPLTARVFVNRVWHWLFGTGIVATPDDFGHAGERPSHPELLDHLAARFVADGWSLKKLVREIVLTEAWRQSSRASEAGRSADPNNRLLHHYPLRRLEAEAIRDALLAVSGRWEPRLFGPPVDPHRQNEDPQKRLFSGPLDGDGRRSIYTKLTIMEPPRLLALFNQPPPKIPTGRRDVTTTPAQSLALLNDPFIAQQARHWAERLVKLPHANPAERIDHMFRTALGRPPNDEELTRWSEAVDGVAALEEIAANDVMSNVGLWSELAHAVFNTKEFVYLR